MRSAHADKWLKSLGRGLEIGGSAHNSFELDVLNVDFIDRADYKQMELVACGQERQVDIEAYGWDIPVPDKYFPFVISSHVIEHIWDPIGAIQEWIRVASKYVYIICPQRDASPYDADKPLTTLEEIIQRHQEGQRLGNLGHVSIFTPETFIVMCQHFGFHILDWINPDDKVGNGFAILIDANDGHN